MLAFFDSLVQRDLSSDETTETENEQQRLDFEEEASAQWDIPTFDLYPCTEYRLHRWRLEINNILGGCKFRDFELNL